MAVKHIQISSLWRGGRWASSGVSKSDTGLIGYERAILPILVLRTCSALKPESWSKLSASVSATALVADSVPTAG